MKKFMITALAIIAALSITGCDAKKEAKEPEATGIPATYMSTIVSEARRGAQPWAVEDNYGTYGFGKNLTFKCMVER